MFVFMLCNHCFAQTTNAVGIHGAFSMAQLTGHPIYHSGVNTWSAGLSHVNAHKNFAIVAELNYEGKGAQGTINYYNVVGDKLLSYDKRLQLHYITLPAMLRYTIGRKKIHAFANAGGYYGFLAAAWANPQDKGVSHNVTSDFNRNDLGLAFGAGGSFNMSEHYSISLEWRNHYGLKNVSASVGNQFNRNNLLQLSLYYQLK